MKKLLNYGRKSKTTTPETATPKKPAYDWNKGPALAPDGNVWFDWHPANRLLWVRPRPTSVPEQPRTTMDNVAEFIEQALTPEAVNCTVNIVCDNTTGSFPSAVIVSIKNGEIVLESSCFCKPGDLNAMTVSKITTIISALGYDATKFYGIWDEWNKRYDRLAKPNEIYNPFDVRLYATIAN